MPTPAGVITIQDVRNFFFAGGGPTDMGTLWKRISNQAVGTAISMSSMRNIGVATAPNYTSTLQTGGLAGTGWNQIQAQVASGAAMRANITMPSPGASALCPVSMQNIPILYFSGGPTLYSIGHDSGQAYGVIDMRWGVAKNI